MGMDIDLLFTKAGEAGLIADESLVKKAAGVVFNTVTGILTIEFVDMDYNDLNIPVEKDYYEMLDYCFLIHIGAYKNGRIAQAYQVPLMIADDPYRGDMMKTPPEAKNPVLNFERFIKSCAAGQPVHREDLGNEDSMRCVLGEAVPAQLQFAPHLARRRNFEAAPKTGLGFVPPGLGLGGSGSGGGGSTGIIRKDEPEE
jgi:hypothetical protein